MLVLFTYRYLEEWWNLNREQKNRLNLNTRDMWYLLIFCCLCNGIHMFRHPDWGKSSENASLPPPTLIPPPAPAMRCQSVYITQHACMSPRVMPPWFIQTFLCIQLEDFLHNLSRSLRVASPDDAQCCSIHEKLSYFISWQDDSYFSLFSSFMKRFFAFEIDVGFVHQWPETLCHPVVVRHREVHCLTRCVFIWCDE